MQRLLLDAASTKQSAVVSAGSVADEDQRHITPSGTDELDPAFVNRVVVTTSTIEDWLWRGDDPVVKHMNLYVYAMWIYRVDKTVQN